MDTVVELLAAQAGRTPDAVALACGDEQLTYRQLEERTNQLGHHLRDRGVGPDVVVGLHLERSADLIVGLLGILKAGGAYLPLEPGTPPDRLALILASARPPVVVTRQAAADEVTGAGAVPVGLDTDRDAIATARRDPVREQVDPGTLAYVIYTSGSTGVPKGIMIDHRALRDRVVAKTEVYGFGPGDRVLQFTSLGFDAAAAEIYPTLLAGATLVVHPDPSWTSPPELMTECERLGITGLMLPPVYLQLLVDALTASGRSIPWLRCLITGGESIPVARLAAWARLTPHGPRVVYAYGPTETTIAATLYLPPTDPELIERLTKVPIGRPLPGTGAYVLDEELRPVGDGEVGELWITGSGLARGYVGDPALTARLFRPSPFGTDAGARMYRTGDLVRRTDRGELEFLGRADTQVKVRGFRVDLGEVETALAAHPGLGPVVAVADRDRLVAYCVPRDGVRPAPRELHGFLGRRLPDYMIPSVFVLLDALPLLPGGKVDLRALPAARAAAEPEPEGGEPGSPMEVLLAEIWCELLDRDRIGLDEEFFEIGGNSLLAVQTVARLREQLGIEVPLRVLFSASTVGALADELTELCADVAGADLAGLLTEVERMSEADALAGVRPERERGE
jgi:amino acid adenylation domain-containing protein